MIHPGTSDAIRDLLAPDVKWHSGDPSARGACHNREQAFEFIRRAQGPWAGGELADVRDAGDEVVVILRPPSHGPESPSLVANLTTLRGGKVVEMVHYPDPTDALAAAGK